jgi:hypothetical protein
MKEKVPWTGTIVGALEPNFEKTYGVPIKDVERLVFLQPNDRNERGFIVTTAQPFDEKKVKETLLPSSQDGKHKDKSYFVARGGLGRALHLASKTTYLLMPSEASLKSLLDKEPAKEAKGPLAEALRAAARKSPIVYGTTLQSRDLEGLKQNLNQMKQGGAPNIEAVTALIDTKSAAVVVPSAGQDRIQVSLGFADDAKSEKGVQGARIAATNYPFLLSHLATLHLGNCSFELVALSGQLDKHLSSSSAARQGTTVVLAPATSQAQGKVVKGPQPKGPQPAGKGSPALVQLQQALNSIQAGARNMMRPKSPSVSVSKGPSAPAGGGTADQALSQFVKAVQANDATAAMNVVDVPFIEPQTLSKVTDRETLRKKFSEGGAFPPNASLRITGVVPTSKAFDLLVPDPELRKKIEEVVGSGGFLGTVELTVQVQGMSRTLPLLIPIKMQGGKARIVGMLPLF